MVLTLNVIAQRLGFDKFEDEVKDVLKDHKQLQKVSRYTSPAIGLQWLWPRHLTPHTGPRKESVQVRAVRPY